MYGAIMILLIMVQAWELFFVCLPHRDMLLYRSGSGIESAIHNSGISLSTQSICKQTVLVDSCYKFDIEMEAARY